MTVQVIFLILGIALVFAGANFLIYGTSTLAERMGISEFAIGLTVVAVATSLPEMVVSFYSSAMNHPDLSVGNIIGSNIFNTGLILGITALISPIAVSRLNIRRDLPINLFAAFLMLLFGMSVGFNRFTRVEGAVFIILYAIYIFILFKTDSKATDVDDDEEDDDDDMELKNWVLVALVFLSIAALCFGAKLMVDSAVNIAKAKGIPEAFIAITIVAGGTSLPELVTCVVAAAKGRNQIALGNIIGSNISNILLIIGGASLIRPLPVEKIGGADFGMSLLLPLLLLLIPLIFKRDKIGRGEGIILLLLFAGYMALLLLHL